MGCDSYCIGEGDSDFIKFDEMDDEFCCLCTFPHNDGEELTPERIRSLALLGAAVVLYHHNNLPAPIFIPHSIPSWIIDGIMKYLPESKDGE